MTHEHSLHIDPRYEMRPPVEILDHMPQLEVFLDGVIDRIIRQPNKLGKLGIFGESGIGKTALAGQIILDKLVGNKRFQDELKKMGKKFKPHYLSLAMCSKELKARGIIKSEWGNLTAQEYALDSRFMAAAISRAEQDFSNDPDAVHFLIIDTIAVDQLDRGTEAIKAQAQDENFSGIAQQTDLDVQDKATETREAQWKTTDPQKIKEVMEKFSVVFDTEFETEEDVEELRTSSGTKISRERINQEVNQEMWQAKADLLERGCPSFTSEELQDALKPLEELEQDPRFFDPTTKVLLNVQAVAEYRNKVRRLRTEVQKYFYSYLGEKWKLPLDRFLVTENTFIGEYPIHYYYALIKASKLRLGEVQFTP